MTSHWQPKCPKSHWANDVREMLVNLLPHLKHEKTLLPTLERMSRGDIMTLEGHLSDLARERDHMQKDLKTWSHEWFKQNA
jgi:hypothetical protein